MERSKTGEFNWVDLSARDFDGQGAFHAVDLSASVAKAVALGATVVSAPMEVPDMVAFAVLADPAGATFALMNPLETPAT
jgi:hypothetical protein